MNNKKEIKGFTLTEVLTVVVILGVLTAFAVPNFRYQIMRMTNDEAKQILMTVYRGQIERNMDFGSFFVSTDAGAINTALGVGLPTSGTNVDLKHFGTLVTYDPATTTKSCGGSQGVAASLRATDTSLGTYEIYVTREGKFFCWDVGNTSCTTKICSKMGFSTL